jgi:protein-disulfide isomerase
MKNLLVGLAVLAVVAVIGVAAYERFTQPSLPAMPALSGGAPVPAAAAALQVQPGDMVLGQAEAKVTIVEYASLTCPHCAAFHANTLPGLKDRYIDQGSVKLVYRDFPLDGLALRAAMLPHCAGPDRYYGLLGALFARQQQWATAQDPMSALGAIARQAGMSEESFKSCLADKAIEDKVLQSRLEADKSLGVNSTPTLFINGVRYTGALALEQIRAVVDPLIGAK